MIKQEKQVLTGHSFCFWAHSFWVLEIHSVRMFKSLYNSLCELKLQGNQSFRASIFTPLCLMVVHF